MKRTTLVAACWLQIGCAALLFVLSLVAELSEPSLGMNWTAAGRITTVNGGGAADRASIRPGDTLLSIDGRVAGATLPALYHARVGTPMTVRVERSGAVISTVVVPTNRVSELRRGVSGGGKAAVSGLSALARVVVNLFVLALAIGLLAARPQFGAARVAALACAYWVGGNDLLHIAGFGTIYSSWGSALPFVVHFVDAVYIVTFHALMLHFALIFPAPFAIVRRNRVWQLAPYIATAPYLVARLAIASSIVPAFPHVRVAPSFLFVYPALLILLVPLLLAVHFRYTAETNDLRRLRFMLVALLPGLLSWLVLVAVKAADATEGARAIAGLLQWLGAAAGFTIFSYATLRHRLFDVRPFIRKSIQYAFARGTLLVGMSLPGVALAVFLYTHRRQSLSEVVTSDFTIPSLLLLAMGALLRYRKHLINAIDRRFFRESYDSRQALQRVLSMIQRGTDIAVLGRVALHEIEKALHPIHVSLWLPDSSESSFQRLLNVGEDRLAPRLERRDPLPRLIASIHQPLEISLDRPSAGVRRLPPETQQWLATVGAALVVPLSVDREILGFLVLGERLSEEPYDAEDRELLTAVASQLALTEDYGRLELLARRDPLTEALNRHAFYSLLDKRRIFPFQAMAGCVAVIDVDDLKTINDRFGHSAGDMAIRRVATAVRSVVRADDLVFRWGGDEFLVILYGIEQDEVVQRLGTLDVRIRQASAGSDFDFPLTVSFGVASFEEMVYISAAIEEADRAMYVNKGNAKKDA